MQGPGKSNPLKCDDIGEAPANLNRYFGTLFPVSLIRACREKLEKVADLTLYTTPIVVDDLDEVRGALGYERVNLAGASYGTLTAQAFMRQHPDRVRSAFLIGVVTPDFKLPLPFARAAQNALDLALADCAADQACHGAFPNAKSEFDAVLSRFKSRGPVDVTMLDPVTERLRPVTLERENYVERLRALLYSTAGARSFRWWSTRRSFRTSFRFRPSLFATTSVDRRQPADCPSPSPVRRPRHSLPMRRSSPRREEHSWGIDAFGRTWLPARSGQAARFPGASPSRSNLQIPVVLFSGEADQ